MPWKIVFKHYFCILVLFPLNPSFLSSVPPDCVPGEDLSPTQIRNYQLYWHFLPAIFHIHDKTQYRWVGNDLLNANGDSEDWQLPTDSTKCTIWTNLRARWRISRAWPEQYKNRDQPNTGLGTTAGKRAEAGYWEIFPFRRKFYLILYKFIVSDKSVARPLGGVPQHFSRVCCSICSIRPKELMIFCIFKKEFL